MPAREPCCEHYHRGLRRGSPHSYRRHRQLAAMNEIKQLASHPSRSAPIWLAVLPLFMGGFITGIGLQWIPHDPAKIHAPYWVIVVGGLVFVSAGLAMLSAGWTRYARLQT